MFILQIQATCRKGWKVSRWQIEKTKLALNCNEQHSLTVLFVLQEETKRKRPEEKGEAKNERMWKVTAEVQSLLESPGMTAGPSCTNFSPASQVPDPSQVTAVATQSSVAVWLTIYYRPSDSITSLLRSPINTASAPRDSTGWDVCWRPRPPPLMGAAAFDADPQNGSVGGSVEPPLTCTRHNGRAWEPVQFGTKLIIVFSCMPVITVSWSFSVFKGDFT